VETNEVRAEYDFTNERCNMIDRIVVNPNVHFGKPCVTGTRITVQNVLELLTEGLSFTEIVQDYYPDLEFEDIRACVELVEE